MNYITIIDFMVRDLKLRGNELIIYALIYGFSQDQYSDFHGSLSYIQDRTGLTRQTVLNVLDKLIDRRLIIKETEKKKQKCFYKTSQNFRPELVKKLDRTSQKFRPELVKKLDSIINKEEKENIYTCISTEIIEYLNKKSNSNFRIDSRNNRLHISARVADGYKLEDFKKVIDIKCEEWLGTPMEKYLNPETLFRLSNFEKYLNQKKSYKSNLEQMDLKEIEGEIFDE